MAIVLSMVPPERSVAASVPPWRLTFTDFAKSPVMCFEAK
jgi:hypothetical protein